MKQILLLLAMFCSTTAALAQGAPPPFPLPATIGIPGGQSLTGNYTLPTSITGGTYTLGSDEWWPGQLVLPSGMSLSSNLTIVAPANPGQFYNSICNHATLNGHTVSFEVSGQATPLPVPASTAACTLTTYDPVNGYVASGGAVGAVTTTGSPTSGAFAMFSGATTITNAPAQAANTVVGNCTTSSGVPTACVLTPAMLPAGATGYILSSPGAGVSQTVNIPTGTLFNFTGPSPVYFQNSSNVTIGGSTGAFAVFGSGGTPTAGLFFTPQTTSIFGEDTLYWRGLPGAGGALFVDTIASNHFIVTAASGLGYGPIYGTQCQLYQFYLNGNGSCTTAPTGTSAQTGAFNAYTFGLMAAGAISAANPSANISLPSSGQINFNTGTSTDRNAALYAGAGNFTGSVLVSNGNYSGTGPTLQIGDSGYGISTISGSTYFYTSGGSFNFNNSLIVSGRVTASSLAINGGSAFTGNQGTGALLPHATGTYTAGDYLKVGSGGDFIDGGGAPGTAAFVNTGTSGGTLCLLSSTCVYGAPVISSVTAANNGGQFLVLNGNAESVFDQLGTSAFNGHNNALYIESGEGSVLGDLMLDVCGTACSGADNTHTMNLQVNRNDVLTVGASAVTALQPMLFASISPATTSSSNTLSIAGQISAASNCNLSGADTQVIGCVGVNVYISGANTSGYIPIR